MECQTTAVIPEWRYTDTPHVADPGSWVNTQSNSRLWT